MLLKSERKDRAGITTDAPRKIYDEQAVCVVTKNLPQIHDLRVSRAPHIGTVRSRLDRPDLQVLLDPIHKAFSVVYDLRGILKGKRCCLQIVILLFTGFARFGIESAKLGFDGA